MGSSGNTPSPPERTIRLGVVLVRDDDPRRCTGRRLLRLGLAVEVPTPHGSGARPVVLDPYAPVPLTSADRRRAESYGLVAIDCSWNALSSRHARLVAPPRPLGPPGGRRLPALVASNPQHFGRLGELNTAEALAAALCLVGHRSEGERLLAGFAGARSFFELNRDRLDRYAATTSPEELLRAERELFGER